MSEYEGHSDIIYAGVIDDRIAYLEARHDLPGADTCTTCDPDEHDELEVLIQFREDVISEGGSDSAWNDSSGFIADTYFDNYVNSDMEGMYGSEVINGLDRFLDWGAIKDEYMERFYELDFDGVTYWIDKL
jgi:hypothetical protein